MILRKLKDKISMTFFRGNFVYKHRTFNSLEFVLFEKAQLDASDCLDIQSKIEYFVKIFSRIESEK
jgi:hypothetical protein